MNSEQRIEEKVPFFSALFISMQHILLMNAYIVPIIIAAACGMSASDTTYLIQATFLASGIATLLQAVFFMKYPIVYGSSFVPVGAIVGIYMANTTYSFGYVIGASLIASFVIFLMGITKVYDKVIHRLLTPLVSYTIVLCIGITLIILAVKGQVITENGMTPQENLIVAMCTVLTMVILSLLGSKKIKGARIFQISSGILAILIGTLIALRFTSLDVKQVITSPLLSMPKIAFIHFPVRFNLSSILTMILIYIVIMSENMGTWLITSAATKTKLTTRRMNDAVIGVGVVNMISSMIGCTAISAFSSNAGMLTVTKNYSRHIFKYVGILLILIGFSNKLSALVAIIPTAVIGGLFLLIACFITVSGISLFSNLQIRTKETYVVAISIMTAVLLSLVPEGFFSSLPPMLNYILSSSIASSAIVAVISDRIIKN